MDLAGAQIPIVDRLSRSFSLKFNVDDMSTSLSTNTASIDPKWEFTLPSSVKSSLSDNIYYTDAIPPLYPPTLKRSMHGRTSLARKALNSERIVGHEENCMTQIPSAERELNVINVHDKDKLNNSDDVKVSSNLKPKNARGARWI